MWRQAMDKCRREAESLRFEDALDQMVQAVRDGPKERVPRIWANVHRFAVEV